MKKEEFSIYESPFSDETKKLRLNCLIASLVCLFIGLTERLPVEFSLLGIKFSSNQQETIGLFIFSISTYIFLHFLSSALVETAKWVHPFYKGVVAKKRLLKHPGFDETDFMDWELFLEDDQDLNAVSKLVSANAEIYVYGKLRPLYFFIYPKLAIEIIVPIIVGIYGLVSLWLLITRLSP